MFQLDVNGYDLKIDGEAVSIDGERLPIKLKRGLFGVGKPMLDGNVINIGKNEIIIAPAFIVVNGARFNLPQKGAETGEDVVIDGFHLPKKTLVGRPAKEQRSATLIAASRQNARQPSVHQPIAPKQETRTAQRSAAAINQGSQEDLGK